MAIKSTYYEDSFAEACSAKLVLRGGDDLHAEMITIDESLCRTELSPAQTALQTARRKDIYEALHPETKAGAAQAAGANKKMGRGNVAANSAATSFTGDTVAKTGKSEGSVRVDAARGEAIGDDDLRLGRADGACRIPRGRPPA